MIYPNREMAFTLDGWNTYEPKLSVWSWLPGVGRPTGSAFKAALKQFQKSQFRDTKRKKSWGATHTRCFLGDDLGNLSVTTPRAIIEHKSISELTNGGKKPLTVVRYKYINLLSPEDVQVGIKAALDLVGTEYDYKQILGMARNIISPGLNDDLRAVAGDPDKAVCSVGFAISLWAAIRAAVERGVTLPSGEPLPQPFGQYDPATGRNSVQSVSPCKLENLKNLIIVYEC